MRRNIIETLAICLYYGLWTVNGLEPYDKFREMSCSSTHPTPVDVNSAFLSTLTYQLAGSKYLMYRLTSYTKHYLDMPEYQFYYDFCLRCKQTGNSSGTLYDLIGFGQILRSYWGENNEPGVFYDVSSSPVGFKESANLTVTLTDGKTFAFFYDCWRRTKEASWFVGANTPEISKESVKAIEGHAMSFGFRRQNFVFLRYEGCPKFF